MTEKNMLLFFSAALSFPLRHINSSKNINKKRYIPKQSPIKIDSLDSPFYSDDFIILNKTDVQTLIKLEAGKYYLEAWGAGNPCSENSLGGYSQGYLEISQPTNIYVTVGSTPQIIDGKNKSGFNGGGEGPTIESSGSGASDIRISENDLYHRIIVAGGAGGCGQNSAGSGGGLNGEDGSSNDGTHGIGGTQVPSEGSFLGVGESSLDYPAGGGGFFGGTAAYSFNGGGGGGSGYVFTEKSEYTHLSEKYFLTDASTSQKSNNPHQDTKNGAVKITVVSLSCHTVDKNVVKRTPLFPVYYLIDATFRKTYSFKVEYP